MRKVEFDVVFFFFQAEDGIRDLVRSRGLGDVYKRQADDTKRRSWTERSSREKSSLESPDVPSIEDTGDALSLIHI